MIGWAPLLGTLLALALLAWTAGVLMGRGPRAAWRGFVVGVTVAFVGAVCLWLAWPPAQSRKVLFEGVTYVRALTGGPHRAVVHLVRVDLDADGVAVFVTPADAPGDDFAHRPRRTSTFLREFGLQLAVNGGHFERQSPGQRVFVMGMSVSEGSVQGRLPERRPALAVTEAGRVVVGAHSDPSWRSAVTGMHRLVEGGARGPDARRGSPEPMTAAGTDAQGRTLFLVVVEGRQPWRSVGLDGASLADLLIEHGVYDAVSLDGGGSSTLAVSAPILGARLLSRPIHLGVPGLERPVGNHIGIRARALHADPR